jgi:hypothetical protein
MSLFYTCMLCYIIRCILITGMSASPRYGPLPVSLFRDTTILYMEVPLIMLMGAFKLQLHKDSLSVSNILLGVNAGR